jgi:hypothetical protein
MQARRRLLSARAWARLASCLCRVVACACVHARRRPRTCVRARTRAPGALPRLSGRPCSRAVYGGLARPRERTFLYSTQPSEVPLSGVGGGSCCAISGAARSAGDQGRRAQRVPRSLSRRVRPSGSDGRVIAGALATKPWAPSTAAQSYGGRRPEGDRGRMSATGTPIRPATHSLRAPAQPAPRFAPRRSARTPQAHHATFKT